MDPKLGKFIDEGAFGEVYEITLQDKVGAVKVLTSFYSEGVGIVDLNFVNTFSHPNLVETNDFFFSKAGLNLVMERVTASLDNYLEDPEIDFPYLFPISVKLVFELACVLKRIHDSGYIHGDLHSSQIGLLIPQKLPQVKLLDFSLSRYIGTGPSRERASEIRVFINLAMKILIADTLSNSQGVFKKRYLDQNRHKPKEASDEDWFSLMQGLYQLYTEPNLTQFLNRNVFRRHNLTCPPEVISPFRNQLLQQRVPCPDNIFSGVVVPIIKQLSVDTPLRVLVLGVHLFYVCYSHVEALPQDLIQVCLFVANAVLYPNPNSDEIYPEDKYGNIAFASRMEPSDLDLPENYQTLLSELLHYTHGVSFFETVYDMAPDNGVLLAALKLFFQPSTANVNLESLASYKNEEQKIVILDQLPTSIL